MPVRQRFASGAAVLALAGVFTISCGGINDPSKNQTETLTGTVSTRGAESKPLTFSVSNNGEISIKVTSFTPAYNGTFALSYGLGDTSSCSLLNANPFATVSGPALAGAVFQKGTYCVVVGDNAGTFPTAGVTFTLTVSHP